MFLNIREGEGWKIEGSSKSVPTTVFLSCYPPRSDVFALRLEPFLKYMGDVLFEPFHKHKYFFQTLLVNDILAKCMILGLHSFYSCRYYFSKFRFQFCIWEMWCQTDSFSLVCKLIFWSGSLKHFLSLYYLATGYFNGIFLGVCSVSSVWPRTQQADPNCKLSL